MKTLLAFCALVLFVSLTASAQTKPVKIVFDVSSKDTLVHQTTLRHVSAMAKAYPDSQFEVVIYSGSLAMVTKDKSTVSKGIQALESNKNVSFKVCAQTMKRHNVEQSQLLPSVTIVPDGILEIVTKQSEGWGYIKEAAN